jgi:chromosome segregation ATPase
MLNLSHGEHEARTIREIAREIMSQLRQQGEHFCLHEREWGEVRSELKSISEEMKLARNDIREMRDELGGLRGERRIIVAVVGGVSSAIGAIGAMICGR